MLLFNLRQEMSIVFPIVVSLMLILKSLSFRFK